MINNIKVSSCYFLLLALLVMPFSCQSKDEGRIVHNVEEFEKALGELKPGDTLKLANGVWKDAELVFQGTGTAEAPIVLMAEEPGKVSMEGNSNLSLSGQYLVVKGLIFKNGFTQTGEVISFRKDSKNLAFNSRVTECVIDNYNKPNRNDQDSWVMMYGQNNRFDHNHLEGKRNQGVTMAVRLNSEDSQNNHHRIDHNYFGPRPVLGSNGGETLRVGTSQYSLTESHTVIENNYFEKCNGETEIVSIKSGKNIIRGNVFLESKGSLTLRHGNGNLIERNIFLGNNVPETGGVRIINAEHKVVENYFQDLEGDKFRAGIAIMNGIYDSPINRYHQVKNATIARNSFINVAHMELAVGSDEERTATPEGCLFTHNLILNKDGKSPFKAYDKIDGISFEDNSANVSTPLIPSGIAIAEIPLEKAENGLYYPKSAGQDRGAPRDLVMLDKSLTGVSWYPKTNQEMVFSTGTQIEVVPGLNSISEALKEANPGDILHLTEGEYNQNRVLNISFPITIKGDSPADSRISFEGTHLFEILNGGGLQLENLQVSGRQAADAAGNAVIKVTPAGTLKNYKVKVLNSEFVDMTINHSFNFLEASKGSFADTIMIENSAFKQFTGSILSLEKETDDLGKYNAEYVIMNGNSFDKIGDKVIDIYRGGTDESTFGPYVYAKGNELSEVGNSSRNLHETSFYFYGVQWLSFEDNSLTKSKPVMVTHTVGEPVVLFSNNTSDLPELRLTPKN